MTNSITIYDVLRMLLDRVTTWKTEEEHRRYVEAVDNAENNRVFKQEGDFQL